MLNYAYEIQKVREGFIIQGWVSGEKEGLPVDRWDDTEMPIA